VVVLELVLGILVGPSGAGWVTSEGAIGFLGEFGLIFLFFQAGFEFEFDQSKIGTAPLRLGAVAWLASLGLTSVFIGLLYIVGLVRAPLLVGLVLPTTSFGILIPILRQTGDLESDFGRYVLGAAAISELGPRAHHLGTQLTIWNQICLIKPVKCPSVQASSGGSAVRLERSESARPMIQHRLSSAPGTATSSAIATLSMAKFSPASFGLWAFVIGQLRLAHPGKMGMWNG
jgi:Sodium/hydrogen exchanger family